jgi:uncharacterized protein (DUF58 family)
LFGAIVTQSEVYFRLVYLAIAILLISFLITLFSTQGIIINRKARVRRKQVGEIFAEQFEIVNTRRYPRIWLAVNDECPMYGKTGSKVLSWIGGKQTRTYISHSRLHQRGSFSLGPTVITSGDPLGLFLSRAEYLTNDTLLVLPHVVNIHSFPTPAGFLTGGRVLGRRAFEVTPQAGGVRDYAPGDPQNRIHWLSTVKKNRLMVKEFEQDPRADVWIMLDAEKYVHAREEGTREIFKQDPFWRLRQDFDRIVIPPDSFEYGVSIAGSVSNYYISRGKAVGLVSAAQSTIYLSAERGERQQYRILENLAFLRCDGKLPLLALVEAQTPNFPQGSTVVIITTTNSERLNLTLNFILQRRLKPVVILIDISTFNRDNKSDFSVHTIEGLGVPAVLVENYAELDDVFENGFGIRSHNISKSRDY